MGNPPVTWDQGRQPGRLVLAFAALATLLAAVGNLAMSGRLSLFFDLCFVVVCLAAALWVDPRDGFAVGVAPPLLLLGTVLPLAVVHPAAVADARDAVAQAVVSGLAHRATALVAGFAVAAAVLAVRQVTERGRREPGRAAGR